jgi:hypothetical protein
MKDKSKNLAMFIDIHAHSTASSIFAFSPEDSAEHEQGLKFTKILDDMSEYFDL